MSYSSVNFKAVCRAGMFGGLLVSAISSHAITDLDEGVGTHVFVAPAAGDYTLILSGGDGGDAFTFDGGLGATVTATFTLAAAESVTISVGGEGFFSGTYSGGGGGSFAYLTVSDTLLVAAGGGGGSSTATGSGGDGSQANSALVVAAGAVAGVNGGDGACCGTSSAVGAGGLSSVNTGLGTFVGNAAFAVSSSAVAGGSVLITRSPYSVSATVSGLTGSGLELQLNGAESLPVASNGQSTFLTTLANSAAYAVTVSTQPTGQTCSVTDGSGTIALEDVADIVVDCVDVAAPPAPTAAEPPRPVPTMSVYGLGMTMLGILLVAWRRIARRT